ncbi:hypothetical protein JCM6882_003292 [Rhodosporidiobolus microsporus]
MSSTESPFAFCAPSPPPTAPSSSPSSLLDVHLPSSALLPRVKQLTDALYEYKVGKEVKRQVEQLRGELRDEYRSRSRAVKMDYLARLVPEQEGQEDGEAVEEQLERADLAKEDEASSSSAPPLPPTILSDADEVAAMSSRVDEQVEASLQAQVAEAEKLVGESVRKTIGMEVELWIGQTVLDAFDQASGDEENAAKLVEAALEDRLFEDNVPLPSSA